MIAVKSLWPLVKESVSQWSDDYAPSMGAALAYYTIFSIAPLLLIVDRGRRPGVRRRRGARRDLRAAARADGRRRRDGDPGPARERERAGRRASSRRSLGVVRAAHRRDDRVRRAAERARPHLATRRSATESAGSWRLLRARLLSFGMILGIGFLLHGVAGAQRRIWPRSASCGAACFAGWEFALQALNFVVSFAIITGLFAMIYKLMPPRAGSRGTTSGSARRSRRCCSRSASC